MRCTSARCADRWGVGTLDQAFTGYAALVAETGLHWTSVLGLPLNAARDEIQQKYLRLVRERNAHPDVGGSREEFEKLTNARREAFEEIESKEEQR